MIRMRSNILVHWTGKDLLNCDTDRGIQQHVDRLVNIYREGLHFNVPPDADIISSVNPEDVILPNLPCICFSELRIRNAHQLAPNYGKMGIGFRREYLMKYGANPVFYLQSADSGIVNTNISQLEKIVKPEYLGAAKIILAYCKPMNRKGEKNLSHYEDHEWRIVKPTGGIPLPPEFKEGANGNKMSFDFDQSEVEVIVFPNHKVRDNAMTNNYLSRILKTKMPMMLDHDACTEL